jgi:hypothetical protein
MALQCKSTGCRQNVRLTVTTLSVLVAREAHSFFQQNLIYENSMRQVAYRDRQFVEAQHPNQRLRRHFIPQKENSNELNVKRELLDFLSC